MPYGTRKIAAASNKEMLLEMYEGWKKTHPEIVAKYPAVDPAWGVRKIDAITAPISREVMASVIHCPECGDTGHRAANCNMLG